MAKQKKQKPSLLLRLYKGLVVVSVLIIVAAVAFRFYLPPPPVAEPEISTPQGETVTHSSSRKDGFYTFLLMGSDNGNGNSDTIMVVGYDTKGGIVSLVSVPRDTMVYREWSKYPKINAAFSRGVDVLKAEVSALLGIPIDFTIHVTLDAFIRVVDTLGGITYNVPQRMYHDDHGGFVIDLQGGEQHLDGRHTLELVRFRGYPNADIGRTEVQQGVIKALISKALSLKTIGKIEPLIEIFEQEVDTNLAFTNMLWFATTALKTENLVVQSTTLEGKGNAIASGYSWCFELDIPSTVDTVNRYLSPYTEPLTAEDLSLRRASGYH